MMSCYNPTPGETGKSFHFQNHRTLTQHFPGCWIAQSNARLPSEGIVAASQTELLCLLHSSESGFGFFRSEGWIIGRQGGKQTVNLLPCRGPNARALPRVCHGNGAKPPCELHLKIFDGGPGSLQQVLRRRSLYHRGYIERAHI